MRIRLVVSYDGTDFKGWAQQTGWRTIQGTLKEAVRRVSGEEIEIWGASRTDSGAHAKGQVCHFDTEVGIPPEKWTYVLNRVLPPDLVVKTSRRTKDDFNARFMAQDRFYRYRILTGPADPFRARFTHYYGRPLDLDRMKAAAEAFTGDHDFRAFTEELDPSVRNTRRRIFRFSVEQVRDEVWVDVVGTAFLRGMMRRMAGTILEIGRNHRPIEEVSQLLDPQKRNSLQWPVVLPACGLCLMRVRYPRRLQDHRLHPSNNFTLDDD